MAMGAAVQIRTERPGIVLIVPIRGEVGGRVGEVQEKILDAESCF